MSAGAAQAGESTRDRILRVAAEIFAEKGYHGTGVAELGDAAGIRRGALYYHIGSKEDLLYDLSKRHVEEALERGRKVVESDLRPIEKLRALVREHLAALVARRSEVTVVMREMHALTGDRAERLKQLRDAHQNLFRQVLEEGVEEGVFRSCDSVTVLAILGMLNWTYVWFDPERGSLAIEKLADRMSDIFVYGELQTPSRQAPER
ncbi:TetR/AcrR family transcriptional regulator [Streptomyces flaveolus]|uniref:TetR/AcrR family transcriptional regulator n=1 Tax=Streptomyces flaveolus TaxID=67297 RepID=UPI003417EF3A